MWAIWVFLLLQLICRIYCCAIYSTQHLSTVQSKSAHESAGHKSPRRCQSTQCIGNWFIFTSKTLPFRSVLFDSEWFQQLEHGNVSPYTRQSPKNEFQNSHELLSNGTNYNAKKEGNNYNIKIKTTGWLNTSTAFKLRGTWAIVRKEKRK